MIFSAFLFLVFFAMLIALCWTILVMFLFRLSMSSCSSRFEKVKNMLLSCKMEFIPEAAKGVDLW